MRYLIIILASLILVGCADTVWVSKRAPGERSPWEVGKGPSKFDHIKTYDHFVIDVSKSRKAALACAADDITGKFKGCGMGSHTNQEDANYWAMKQCQQHHPVCIITKQHNLWVKQEYQKQADDIQIDRLIKQCEYIGFKKNTEKMGQCVLQIQNTEIQIAQSNAQISSSQAQQRSAETADTANRIIILNETLKLLNPPRQNFNCQARPFGIYTNIHCN